MTHKWYTKERACDEARVEINGEYIKNYKNPSERLQMIAVQENGLNIRFIENPTERVIYKAVENHKAAIGWIDNPSKKLQLYAIVHSTLAVQWIRNPYYCVKYNAILQDPCIISHIKSPEDELQLLALQRCYDKDRKGIYNFITHFFFRDNEERFNHEVKKLKLKYGAF